MVQNCFPASKTFQNILLKILYLKLLVKCSHTSGTRYRKSYSIFRVPKVVEIPTVRLMVSERTKSGSSLMEITDTFCRCIFAVNFSIIGERNRTSFGACVRHSLSAVAYLLRFQRTEARELSSLYQNRISLDLLKRLNPSKFCFYISLFRRF